MQAQLETTTRTLAEFSPVTATAALASVLDPALFPWLEDVQDQLAMLAIAGLAGAYVKAAMFPHPRWRERLRQGMASAISAVFLGGLMGTIVAEFVGHDVYAFLAAGFLTAWSGKDAIVWVQSVVFKKQGEKK